MNIQVYAKHDKIQYPSSWKQRLNRTTLSKLVHQCRLVIHRDIGGLKKGGKSCCEYGTGVSPKVSSEEDSLVVSSPNNSTSTIRIPSCDEDCRRIVSRVNYVLHRSSRSMLSLLQEQQHFQPNLLSTGNIPAGNSQIPHMHVTNDAFGNKACKLKLSLSTVID